MKLSGSKKQKVGKTVYLYVKATSESLVAKVSGKLSIRPSAHGNTKTYKLKTVSNRSIAYGVKAKVKLKVPEKRRKAIEKALHNDGKATYKFSVKAHDAAGKASSQGRR